jgi:hypothetical protein
MTSRQSSRQRVHFAVFVPSANNASTGTLIHVIGSPMAGYSLEFKRNYCPDADAQPRTPTPIGQVDATHIIDSADSAQSVDDRPQGNIELVAAQISPPRISQNFLAPVNDVSFKPHYHFKMHMLMSSRLQTEDVKNGLWILSSA